MAGSIIGSRQPINQERLAAADQDAKVVGLVAGVCYGQPPGGSQREIQASTAQLIDDGACRMGGHLEHLHVVGAQVSTFGLRTVRILRIVNIHTG